MKIRPGFYAYRTPDPERFALVWRYFEEPGQLYGGPSGDEEITGWFWGLAYIPRDHYAKLVEDDFPVAALREFAAEHQYDVGDTKREMVEKIK